MSQPEPSFIVPRYKIIVSYDVLPSNQENYFRFAMNEFIPILQEMGLYMTESWHTAYGDYPLRMAVFVSEDLESIEQLLRSERWQELESRFLTYVNNYSIHVVAYRQGFQFIR